MDIIQIILSILIFVSLIVLMGWPCCHITRKTGLPWPLGLIVFLPAGLLILLYIWALRTWPGQEQPTTSAQDV